MSALATAGHALWLVCGITGLLAWAFVVAALLLLSHAERQMRRSRAAADDHSPDLDAWADELAAMNQERARRP